MISLLYSGNAKVFKGLLISLVSVAKNTCEALDVHILTMDLSDINADFSPINEEQRDFTEKIIKKQNEQSRITLHDLTNIFKGEMMNSPNMKNFYTPYAFLRLFADEADIGGRVIYLDTDTVARQDISPLFAMELDGAEFAGVRAVSSTGDFIIGQSEKTKGLFQAAGIQSPGLTSAPAIAKAIVGEIVAETGAAQKEDYKKGRPAQPCFRTLSDDDKKALIAKDAAYGRVICRCETITEGEIIDAIRRPVGARTVDGVKRRTRAGMGRCQGGFCGPRVTQILARELNIPVTEVRKEMRKSYMFYDKETQSGGKA